MIDWIRRRVTIRYMDRLLTAEMERYVCLGPHVAREVVKDYEQRIDDLKGAVEILKWRHRP